MSYSNRLRNYEDNLKTAEEQKKNRKQHLLSKTLQPKQEPTPPSVSQKEWEQIQEELEKFKNLYKKEKKTNEQLTKQMEQQSKKERQEFQVEQQLKTELQQVKKEMFEFTQSYQALQSELKTSKQTNFELRQSMKQKQKEVSTLQRNNEKLFRQLKSNRRLDVSQTRNLRGLNRTVETSRREQKELKKLYHAVVQQNATLKSTIKEKEKEISQLQSHHPNRVLTTLYKGLTVQTFKTFNLALLEKLTNKVRLMEERLHTEATTTPTKETVIEVYGIVETKGGNVVFTDIHGTSYLVINPTYVVEDGIPVRAELVEDGVVKISRTLQFESRTRRTHTKRIGKAKTVQNEGSVSLPNLGQGVKVLVITQRNGIKIRDYLNQYGFDATWHDPFEKSPIHTKKMMDKHDIVLMFWDSMKHYTLDFKEDNDPKYQILHVQQEEKILHRTFFTARELGLVKTHT